MRFCTSVPAHGAARDDQTEYHSEEERPEVVGEIRECVDAFDEFRSVLDYHGASSIEWYERMQTVRGFLPSRFRQSIERIPDIFRSTGQATG